MRVDFARNWQRFQIGSSMLLTADQHARIAARLRAKAAERKLAPPERGLISHRQQSER
jgi:hypothetical protein